MPPDYFASPSDTWPHYRRRHRRHQQHWFWHWRHWRHRGHFIWRHISWCRWYRRHWEYPSWDRWYRNEDNNNVPHRNGKFSQIDQEEEASTIYPKSRPYKETQADDFFGGNDEKKGEDENTSSAFLSYEKASHHKSNPPGRGPQHHQETGYHSCRADKKNIIKKSFYF